MQSRERATQQPIIDDLRSDKRSKSKCSHQSLASLDQRQSSRQIRQHARMVEMLNPQCNAECDSE